MKKSVLALCVASVLTTGCSSMVSKSEYPVSITSNPPQANFVLKNKAGVKVHSGRTPAQITLKASSGFFAGETYQLILNKDGYAEKRMEINSGIDGWYFGNLIFGGILGLLIIDPATGAMFKLPENADAQLDELIVVDKDASLTLVMLDTIPVNQRTKLIPIN